MLGHPCVDDGPASTTCQSGARVMWQIVQAWPFPWGPRGGGDFPYKGLWTGRARGVSIPILKTWCGAEVGVFGAEPVAVQSLSHVRLSVTPRTAAHQTSLSFTISWSLLRLMSIESMMPSNHLVLCHLLLLLPLVFPSIWVFSNDLALHIYILI